MSGKGRLAGGIALGLAIYFIGLFVVPSLGIVKRLLESTPLSPADVTQAVYFVLSMILMLLLSGGKLSTYGFKPAPFRPLVRAILISAAVELVLLVFMIVSVSLAGPPSMPQQVGQIGRSLQRTIISVWLVASTCEELFFRGLLYGYLAPLKERGFGILGKHVSLPVTCCALMFGLGHLCLLGMMPLIVVANIVLATTACGFIAGYFRETTGSLVPAILSHMTFNIVGYSLPLLMGAAG
jgi:membrane protease YdiL (CAAX protease family)